MGEPEPEEAGSLFDDLPKVKPKVKDEFAEKDKKPKEEEKIVITPKDVPKKPEVKPKEKEKVRDEFAEKEKKPKEETKIVITPAVLPAKPEESSSEEEEEEVKPEPKKKLSRSDLKPAVQIKVEAAPVPAVGRRKKKPADDEPKES